MRGTVDASNQERVFTDKRRFTRVVNVQQVTVEVEMSIASHLHRGIRGLRGFRARRKVQSGKKGKRWESNAGEALGGEFSLVENDDFLNVGVRWLLPMRSKGSHGDELLSRSLQRDSFTWKDVDSSQLT